MKSFIYFPCDSNGVICDGFCPSIGDHVSMIRDFGNYRNFMDRFGFTHFAFKEYLDSDLSNGICLSELTILKY